ncbi:MAG: serine/threonine protein kinase [Acidobacteria bacterium]|nr:MAG: serine/threonine protein kinase [Acidobacteriota bacterium]
MTNWSLVGPRFDTACELEGDEREAYLDALRQEDAELHREVVSLLEAAQGRGPLDSIPSMPTVAATSASGSRQQDPARRQIGRYRIDEPVGGGGMGRVFRAVRADGSYDQVVALKVLRWELADGSGVARFHRERQILARLDHPGITRLLDGGVTEDGLPYLVMEWVDGVPLPQYCETSGIDLEGRIELFLQVLDAVAHAHRAAVIHRDLKPSNILVTADGRVKLLDFGISKLADEADEGLTQQGFSPMTPHWASPEQLAGESLTVATDIYSAGAMLYELLAGSPPHRADQPTTGELLRRIESGAIAPPSRLARRSGSGLRVSADLDAVVLRSLERDPERRYPSASELAADLRRVLEHRPVSARRIGWPARLARTMRRNPLITALACSTLLAASVGTWLVLSGRAEARRQAILSQRLGQEVQAIASRQQIVVRDPVHDVSPELSALASRLERLEVEARAGLSDRALALSTVAAGWNAFGEWERARDLLLEARDASAASPSPRELATLLQRLGEAYAGLYRQGLSELRGLRGASLAARRAELRRQWAEPGVEALQSARTLRDELSGELDERSAPWAARDTVAGGGSSAIYAALEMELAGHSDRAEALLDVAVQADPLDADALRLLAELRKDRSWIQFLEGEREQALSTAQVARATFLKALEILRSDPRLHVSLCVLDSNHAEISAANLAQGEGITLPESCQVAATVHADGAAVWTAHASTYMRQAVHRSRVGGELQASLDQCLAAARRAQELGETSVMAEFFEATCLSLGAANGLLDEGEVRTRSLDLYGEILEREPNHLQSLNSFAITLLDRGLERLEGLRGGPDWATVTTNGPEPLADFRRAEELLRRGLDLVPELPLLWNNLGLARKNQGQALAGHDPAAAEEAFAAAREALARARELDDSYLSPRIGLAELSAERADLALSQADVDTAITLQREAAERFDDVAAALPNFGLLRERAARHRLLAVRAASLRSPWELPRLADEADSGWISPQLDEAESLLGTVPLGEASHPCDRVELETLRAWLALAVGDSPAAALSRASEALSQMRASCAELGLTLLLRRAQARRVDAQPIDDETLQRARELAQELRGERRAQVDDPFRADLHLAQLMALAAAPSASDPGDLLRRWPAWTPLLGPR